MNPHQQHLLGQAKNLTIHTKKEKKRKNTKKIKSIKDKSKIRILVLNELFYEYALTSFHRDFLKS